MLHSSRAVTSRQAACIAGSAAVRSSGSSMRAAIAAIAQRHATATLPAVVLKLLALALPLSLDSSAVTAAMGVAHLDHRECLRLT